MQEGLVHHACKEGPSANIITSKDKEEFVKLMETQKIHEV
jgi:hypothetical protein